MKNKRIAILAAIMLAAAPMALTSMTAYAEDSEGTAMTEIVDNDETDRQFTADIEEINYVYEDVSSPITPDNYNGENHLTVKCDDEILTPDNYAVSYTDNDKPGMATVTVTGLGDYAGLEATQTFMILPKLNNAAVTSKNSKIYVSWEKDLTATAYQVIYSQDRSFKTYYSTTITDLNDTDVVLSSRPRLGEHWYVKMRSYVTTTGETHNVTRYGLYTPTREITVSGAISSITIKNNTSVYTGSPVIPNIAVRDTRGYDVPAGLYSTTYTNNTQVGQASVTVKGRGILTGAITKTFIIRPATQNITSYVTTPEYSGSYEGYADIYWKKDTQATAYQVMISQNKYFSASDASTHSFLVKNTNTPSIRLAKYCKPGETWYVKVRSFWTKTGTTVSGVSRYGYYSPTITYKIDPNEKQYFTYHSDTKNYSMQSVKFATVKTTFNLSAKIKSTMTAMLVDSNNRTLDAWQVSPSNTSHISKFIKSGTKCQIKIATLPKYISFKANPVQFTATGSTTKVYDLQYVLPTSVYLPTTWISQYSSAHSSYTLCTPTSVIMAVNGDKNEKWNLYYVAAYAAASGLQSQILQGNWANNYRMANGNWYIPRGMIAPDAVKLVSKYSGGKYTATNLYPTNTTYSYNQIYEILKEQLAADHRVVVMRLLPGGATHASTVIGYYYSNGILYFNVLDPIYGKLTLSAYTLAYQINGTIRIEPRAMIIIN